MAPEVGSGEDYELIPADFWACGKVIEHLCHNSQRGELRDRVQECADKLMEKDVSRRMHNLGRVHLDMISCRDMVVGRSSTIDMQNTE